MQRLLGKLGHPERNFDFIHVGGTCGKGSTATIIASLLGESGYKVGLHISPHIQTIRERIQVQRNMISQKAFIDLVHEVRPVVEEVDRTKAGRVTYFELLVALAFSYFSKVGVDIAVIEVGLGGRLDGTNVREDPLVTVITNVELDHMNMLGNTVEEIAKEKAGIIKKGSIVITGATQGSVRQIITKKVASTSAKRLFLLGKEIEVLERSMTETRETCSIRVGDHLYEGLSIALLGDFQVQNAAIAIACIDQLKEHGYTCPVEKIRNAFSHLSFAGRFEIMQKTPLVILDGAHNPAKMTAFMTSFKKRYPSKSIHLVFGCKKGKDIEHMLHICGDESSSITATMYHAPTDTAPYSAVHAKKVFEIARQMYPTKPVVWYEQSHEATEHALDVAHPEEIVLITGSLYLVGEIRSIWKIVI